MDIFKIQTAFMEISGLNEKDCANYINLFKSADIQITKKVKNGVDIQKNEPLLIEVAASVAYYMYCLMQSKKMANVSVLDVKIELDKNISLNSAKKYKDEMMLLASDILVDENFDFIST